VRRDAHGVLSAAASQREYTLKRIEPEMEALIMATSSARTSRSKSSASRSSSSSGKKTYPTKSGKRSTTPPSRRWSAKVKTDSTKPAPGLFKKSAKEIAEGLAKKSVSPEGPGQGMRMLSFYENRAGKNLSASRKHVLENAKDILRDKEEKQPKGSSRSSGSSRTKSGSTSKRGSSSRSHTRRSSRKAS
jgi:tRNA(adenine34) deaminase